jgi:transcriptional regulator with XRE-family HTH domain
MEFNERLYNLRKQKGLSQEEVANQLNVSRQTISKWESADSTPDMEKLKLLSQLFEITLDELVLGKAPASTQESFNTSELLNALEEKVLATDNKKKARKALKIAGIVIGIFVAVDIISMIIYFLLYGVPS